MTFPIFKGELEVAGKLLSFHARDTGYELQRLRRHPNGDWKAAPAAFRNGRVDPPEAMRTRFGVLYLADSYTTAAVETRVIAFSKNADGNEEFEVVPNRMNAVSPAGGHPQNTGASGLCGP